MATMKNLVLVTGATSGVGLELASLLMDDPSKHVILGSRSLSKGEATAKELQSRGKPGTVEVLHLDVASSDSIHAGAKDVENAHGRLDALVNNAAIGVPSGTLAEQMATSFQINATGPLLMGEAFAPLLLKSTGTPRIVNVSSGAGSVSRRLSSFPAHNFKAPHYFASKAALNMITAEQTLDYGPQGFKVFAYSPGFVISNLGPLNKVEHGAKPTRDGAAPIVNILNGERDADHGCFVRAGGRDQW